MDLDQNENSGNSFLSKNYISFKYRIFFFIKIGGIWIFRGFCPPLPHLTILERSWNFGNHPYLVSIVRPNESGGWEKLFPQRIVPISKHFGHHIFKTARWGYDHLVKWSFLFLILILVKGRARVMRDSQKANERVNGNFWWIYFKDACMRQSNELKIHSSRAHDMDEWIKGFTA